MDTITRDFHGETTRIVLDEEGQPHWVATDVARILGYRMASDMTRLLDEDEKGTRRVRTPGGAQAVTTITESGLYAAIMRSQQPRAREFRRWVTGEVLPAIRQHGGYLTPDAQAQALTDPDFIIQLATQLKSEQEARRALIVKVEQDAPKVEYHDQFVAPADLIQFRTLAQQLHIPESQLREALVAHRWIYAKPIYRWSQRAGKVVAENQWRAYADRRDCFHLVPQHNAPRINGEVRQTLKITPHGAVQIAQALTRWGVIEKPTG